MSNKRITQNNSPYQAFSEKNISLQCEWMQDPVQYFSHWRHRSMACTINYLAALSNNFIDVHPGQTRIGDKIDCTRVHTNRLIKIMVQEGIIQKEYRHRDTCRYFLHPIFYDMSFRKKLQDLIPSLRFIPLILMFAAYGTLARSQSDYVTPPSYKKYVYKSLITKNVNRGYISTDTRQKYWAPPGKRYTLYCYFNGREQMSSNVAERLFSRSLLDVHEELKLTTAGTLWLSSYPDEALTYALEKFKTHTQVIHKPYEWFDRLCKNYCIGKGVKPDYHYAQQLSELLQVPLVGASYVRIEGKAPKYPMSPSQPDTTGTPDVQKTVIHNNHKKRELKREDAQKTHSRYTPSLRRQKASCVWRETTTEERVRWHKKMEQISPEGRSFLEKLGVMIPDAPTRFPGNPNGGIRRVAPPRYKVDEDEPISEQNQLIFEGL